MASIFTKIMNGELPAYKIFADKQVFAFLALDQIRPGHTLVVPRLEAETFLDLREPEYSHVFRTAQKIGQAIQRATQCPRVGLAVQGFEVAHCHIHVVPLWETTDLDFRKAKRLDADEMKRIQSQLIAALEL